ncbi:MAG TPA: DUF2585 family protein [Pyrinomonadaceae bacterium]|jgi:hypothetical protein|nr:DUF2585 family protein [Pyrinomonadaceae bacterium]
MKTEGRNRRVPAPSASRPGLAWRDGARKAGPGFAVFALLAATALELHRQGRLWTCPCGHFALWVGGAWSSETSQQLFDPYSFTHILHGLVLCGLLAWGLPRVPMRWRFFLAVACEAVWELVENTDFVIGRYREATAALGYAGDTVVNSLGDIAACAVGLALARRLGLLRSVLLFVATELVLLVWIRDSFLLNVLLLIYPSEKIRAWQMGH